MKIARRLSAGILALALATSAHAQETKPKATVIGLNTTHYDQAFSTETASLNIFNINDSELWVVGGENYRQPRNDLDAGTINIDFGVKYVKGRNLFRATTVRTKERDNIKLSYGADWDTNVASNNAGTFGVSLLGDVSSVNGNTDFGIGPKLTFSEDHSFFLLYSNRGGAASYRTGYMFLDKDRLSSFYLNYPEGKKPDFETFLGLQDKWFRLSYDAETRNVSSRNLLSLGNKDLPGYATKGFFASQVILTDRSVKDSDFTMYFPSEFFLDPKNRTSGVLRFNAFYNTKTGHMDGMVDGALMSRTRGKEGVVFTLNANKDASGKYYGVGAGYNFGRITPIVKYQTGTRGVLTVGGSFSY